MLLIPPTKFHAEARRELSEYGTGDTWIVRAQRSSFWISLPKGSENAWVLRRRGEGSRGTWFDEKPAGAYYEVRVGEELALQFSEGGPQAASGSYHSSEVRFIKLADFAFCVFCGRKLPRGRERCFEHWSERSFRRTQGWLSETGADIKLWFQRRFSRKP